MLKGRCPLLLKKVERQTRTLSKTVLTACVLHNICFDHGDLYDCSCCGLATIGNLTNNFFFLKKRNGKLDCLICEMFFIKKISLCLNTQSHSISAKLFI